MFEVFRPLRHRTFAMLWGSTLLANIGFWMQDVTLGWLVAGLTSSPSQVAMVATMGMLPAFLFALPAGALGDSVDRRQLLLVAQTLTIALLLLLAWFIASGTLRIGHILAFAFCAGTLTALAGPARQTILPTLVGPEDLRGAVVLGSIGFNGSRAVGPMIGGVVLAAFGPLAAVIGYTISCICVGIVLMAWRPPPTEKTAARLWRDMQDGVSYVLGQPVLRRPLFATVLYFMLVSPLWAFAPLIAKGYAAGDSAVFGLFMMSVGLGAVTGGISPRLNGKKGMASALTTGSLLTAGAFAVIACRAALPLSLAGFFAAGLGWIGVSAGINTHVLMASDARFRTRSISIVMIVFAAGISAGSAIWGQVARVIGISWSFAAAAGLLLGLGLFMLGLRQPRVRRATAL